MFEEAAVEDEDLHAHVQVPGCWMLAANMSSTHAQGVGLVIFAQGHKEVFWKEKKIKSFIFKILLEKKRKIRNFVEKGFLK